MVVDDRDIGRSFLLPDEADPPLVIDPDAVLTTSPSFQCFEPVRGRDSEIEQHTRLIEHPQLAQCDALDVGRKPTTHAARPDQRSFGVGETPYHMRKYITYRVITINQTSIHDCAIVSL